MIAVPCSTCKKSGGCRAEGLMARDAIFNWLSSIPVACQDYTENAYHGVEGCYDSPVNMVSGGRRPVRRAGRFYGSGSPVFLGTR